MYVPETLRLRQVLRCEPGLKGQAVNAQLAPWIDAGLVQLAGTTRGQHDVDGEKNGQLRIGVGAIDGRNPGDSPRVSLAYGEQVSGFLVVKDFDPVALDLFLEAFAHELAGLGTGAGGAFSRVVIGLVADEGPDGIRRESDARMH
jgi:hypothetical protein